MHNQLWDQQAPQFFTRFADEYTPTHIINYKSLVKYLLPELMYSQDLTITQGPPPSLQPYKYKESGASSIFSFFIFSIFIV